MPPHQAYVCTTDPSDVVVSFVFRHNPSDPLMTSARLVYPVGAPLHEPTPPKWNSNTNDVPSVFDMVTAGAVASENDDPLDRA